MINNTASKYPIFALSLILVLGVTGIIVSSLISQPNHTQNLGSKAASTTTITLDVNNSTIPPNTIFDVDATIHPGTNVVGTVKILLNFDPTKLEIVNVTNGSSFPDVLENPIKDNTNGVTSFVGGIGTILPLVTTNVKVATFTFKTKGIEGQTALNINMDKTKAYEIQNSSVVNVLQPSQGTTINVQNPCLALPVSDNFGGTSVNANRWNTNGVSTVSGNKLNLALSSVANETTVGVSTKKQICGDFDMSINLDNFNAQQKNYSVAAFDAFVVKNTGGFYIVLEQNGNNRFIETNVLKSDNTWMQSKSQTFSGTNITLRLKRTGSTLESFYNQGGGWVRLGNYSNVTTDNLAARLYVSSRTPDKPDISAAFSNFSLTANPTASVISDSTVKIILRKMQNLNSSLIPVKITLTNNAGTSILSGIYDFKPVTEGDKTYYTYTFSGLPVLSQSKLWIKPQYYLSKKITTDLQTGTKMIDLSSNPFFGGDIVTEKNDIGDGDNEVALTDYNLLVGHFGSRMPAGGSLADISKDGVVSPTDYSELIGNYGKTGEIW